MSNVKYLQHYIEEADNQVLQNEKMLRNVTRQIHDRVINAFHSEQVTDFHFNGSTGYGYGDQGRAVLEQVFARVFGGEAALVRGQIVSGTHAIYLGLKALVPDGGTLLYLGTPYDTLSTALDAQASFRTETLCLDDNGLVSLPALKQSILRLQPAAVAIQRSCGYDARRKSFSIDYIKDIISVVKSQSQDIDILVDNCYGEFVESQEPPMVGADLTAGSLIKNPGGGIAPGGGYLVGRRSLIDKAADILTAPGLGKDVGASFWDKRLVFQGLYLAPLMVLEALCGMTFASSLFNSLGFSVGPGPRDQRTDIIQRIDLGDRKLLEQFCRCVQRSSPVDAHVSPQAGQLPGYVHSVIMAAGTFVQGASLEFSADAPIREPFSVFLQGGLSREYTRRALLSSVEHLSAAALL